MAGNKPPIDPNNTPNNDDMSLLNQIMSFIGGLDIKAGNTSSNDNISAAMSNIGRAFNNIGQRISEQYQQTVDTMVRQLQKNVQGISRSFDVPQRMDTRNIQMPHFTEPSNLYPTARTGRFREEGEEGTTAGTRNFFDDERRKRRELKNELLSDTDNRRIAMSMPTGDYRKRESDSRYANMAGHLQNDASYDNNRNFFRSNDEIVDKMPKAFSYIGGGAFHSAMIEGAYKGMNERYNDRGGILSRTQNLNNVKYEQDERASHLRDIAQNQIAPAIKQNDIEIGTAMNAINPDKMLGNAYINTGTEIEKKNRNITAIKARMASIIGNDKDGSSSSVYKNLEKRADAKQREIQKLEDIQLSMRDDSMVDVSNISAKPETIKNAKQIIQSTSASNDLLKKSLKETNTSMFQSISGDWRGQTTDEYLKTINYEKNMRNLSGSSRSSYDSVVNSTLGLMGQSFGNVAGKDASPQQNISVELDRLTRNYTGTGKRGDYGVDRNDLIENLTGEAFTERNTEKFNRAKAEGLANANERIAAQTVDPNIRSEAQANARFYRQKYEKSITNDQDYDSTYLSRIKSAGTSSRDVQVVDPDVTDFIRGQSPLKAFKVSNQSGTAQVATSMQGIEGSLDGIISIADSNKGIMENVKLRMERWRSALAAINNQLGDETLTDDKRQSLKMSRNEIVSGMVHYESQGQLLAGERNRTPGEKLTESVGGAIKGVDDFLSRSLNFMQMGLMFSASGFMMQGVGQLPQEAAQMGTQPFISGLAGISGLSTLTGELQSFVGQIPGITSQIQTNLATISSLGGSRVAAESAVGTALDIAKTQPIQFPQAMEIVSALSVYPETKSMATNPAFQKKAFETTQFLSMLAPEQGIGGALFAIRELLGGQTRSLERRFNISTEILASSAGKSNSEFMAMGGGGKINTLWDALNNMFGGQEILLKKGAQVDVQAKNISDTLIQSLIAPLTLDLKPDLVKRQRDVFANPADAKALYGENMWEAITNVATTNVDKEIKADERYGIKTTPEERENRIDKKRQQLGGEMGGTVLGSVGMLMGAINNSVNTMLTNANPAGGISEIISSGFTAPISKTITEYNKDIAQEGLTPEYIKGAGSKFFNDLMSDIKTGFSKVEDDLDSSGITNVMSRVTSVIKSGLSVSMNNLMTGMLRETISSGLALPGTLAKSAGSFLMNALGPSEVDNTPITEKDPNKRKELEKERADKADKATREAWGGSISTAFNVGAYAIGLNERLSGVQRVGGFLGMGGMGTAINSIVTEGGFTQGAMKSLTPALLATGLFAPANVERGVLNRSNARADKIREQVAAEMSWENGGGYDKKTKPPTLKFTALDGSALTPDLENQLNKRTSTSISTPSYKNLNELLKSNMEYNRLNPLEVQRPITKEGYYADVAAAGEERVMQQKGNINKWSIGAKIIGGASAGLMAGSVMYGMSQVDKDDKEKAAYQTAGIAASTAVASFGSTLLSLPRVVAPAAGALLMLGSTIMNAFAPELLGNMMKGIESFGQSIGLLKKPETGGRSVVDLDFDTKRDEAKTVANKKIETLRTQYKIPEDVLTNPDYRDSLIKKQNWSNDRLEDLYKQEKSSGKFTNDQMDKRNELYKKVTPILTTFTSKSDELGKEIDNPKTKDDKKDSLKKDYTDLKKTTLEQIRRAEKATQEQGNPMGIDEKWLDASAIGSKNLGSYIEKTYEKDMVQSAMKRSWVDQYEQNANFITPINKEGDILERLRTIKEAAATEIPRAAGNAGIFDSLRMANFEMGIYGQPMEEVDKYSKMYGMGMQNIMATNPQLASQMLYDPKNGAGLRDFVMSGGYDVAPAQMDKMSTMATISQAGGAALQLEGVLNSFGNNAAQSMFNSLPEKSKFDMILAKEMKKGGKLDQATGSGLSQEDVVDRVTKGESAESILASAGVSRQEALKESVLTSAGVETFEDIYNKAKQTYGKTDEGKKLGVQVNEQTGKVIDYKDMTDKQKETAQKTLASNLDKMDKDEKKEVILKAPVPLPVIIVGSNLKGGTTVDGIKTSEEKTSTDTKKGESPINENLKLANKEQTNRALDKLKIQTNVASGEIVTNDDIPSLVSAKNKNGITLNAKTIQEQAGILGTVDPTKIAESLGISGGEYEKEIDKLLSTPVDIEALTKKRDMLKPQPSEIQKLSKKEFDKQDMIENFKNSEQQRLQSPMGVKDLEETLNAPTPTFNPLAQEHSTYHAKKIDRSVYNTVMAIPMGAANTGRYLDNKMDDLTNTMAYGKDYNAANPRKDNYFRFLPSPDDKIDKKFHETSKFYSPSMAINTPEKIEEMKKGASAGLSYYIEPTGKNRAHVIPEPMLKRKDDYEVDIQKTVGNPRLYDETRYKYRDLGYLRDVKNENIIRPKDILSDTEMASKEYLAPKNFDTDIYSKNSKLPYLKNLEAMKLPDFAKAKYSGIDIPQVTQIPELTRVVDYKNKDSRQNTYATALTELTNQKMGYESIANIGDSEQIAANKINIGQNQIEQNNIYKNMSNLNENPKEDITSLYKQYQISDTLQYGGNSGKFDANQLSMAFKQKDEFKANQEQRVDYFKFRDSDPTRANTSFEQFQGLQSAMKEETNGTPINAAKEMAATALASDVEKMSGISGGGDGSGESINAGTVIVNTTSVTVTGG